MKAALLLTTVVIASCLTEIPCYRLMLPMPGTTLNADSLREEGWIVLPGDTLAFYEIPCD